MPLSRKAAARPGQFVSVARGKTVASEPQFGQNVDREECMKQIRNVGILTVVVLVTVLLTLAFSAAAAPKLATQPGSVAAVPVAPLATPLPEPHPEIHAALEAMRNAREHLEHAAHDFDGHRVESIKHLDAAIHEAEVCEHMR